MIVYSSEMKLKDFPGNKSHEPQYCSVLNLK